MLAGASEMSLCLHDGLAEDSCRVGFDVRSHQPFWNGGDDENVVLPPIETGDVNPCVVGAEERTWNIKHDIETDTLIRETRSFPDDAALDLSEAVVDWSISGRDTSAVDPDRKELRNFCTHWPADSKMRVTKSI